MQKFLQRFTFRSIILGIVLGLLIVGSGYGYLYHKNDQAIKFNEMYG
jgi:hypothetical protein